MDVVYFLFILNQHNCNVTIDKRKLVFRLSYSSLHQMSYTNRKTTSKESIGHQKGKFQGHFSVSSVYTRDMTHSSAELKCLLFCTLYFQINRGMRYWCKYFIYFSRIQWNQTSLSLSFSVICRYITWHLFKNPLPLLFSLSYVFQNCKLAYLHVKDIFKIKWL